MGILKRLFGFTDCPACEKPMTSIQFKSINGRVHEVSTCDSGDGGWSSQFVKDVKGPLDEGVNEVPASNPDASTPFTWW